MNYYVYIFLNPFIKKYLKYENIELDFEPFYVGKGKGSRVYRHVKELEQGLNYNPKKNELLSKIINEGLDFNNFIYKIENLTEEESFDLEVKLIKYFGRLSFDKGPLTNLTDGGEGSSGSISPNKGKKYEEMFDLETCIRLKRDKSNMFSGNKNPMFGKNPMNKGKKYEEYLGVDRSNKIKERLSKLKTRIIYQYSLNGDFIKEWESVEIASKELNIYKGSIHNALGNYRTKSSGGFQWKYFRKDKIRSIVSPKFELYINNELIGKYEKLGELSEIIKISTSNISSRFKDKTEFIYKNFLVKRL